MLRVWQWERSERRYVVGPVGGVQCTGNEKVIDVVVNGLNALLAE